MAAVTRMMYLIGTLVAVVGWFLLVRLAVREGNAAQAGESLAWVWVGLAATGAVLCLVAAVVLLRRLAMLVGLVRTYRPRH